MFVRSTLVVAALCPLMSLVTMGCASSAPAETPAPNDEKLASATVSGHAPVSPFVPPQPAGCVAATAYDLCFAFTGATPLAVVIELPEAAHPHAIAVVHFHRDDDTHDGRVLDGVKFPIDDAKRELRLYFQVYPGSYRIEVGVDADGDGDPEGPNDLVGWSSENVDAPIVDESAAALVDVAASPIEAKFALAPRP
jgi:hypothetical protein